MDSSHFQARLRARPIRLRREPGGVLVFDRTTRTCRFHPGPLGQDDTAAIAAVLGCSREVIGPVTWVEVKEPYPGPEPLSAPIAAYLEISSACNMACSHCFKGARPYSRTLGEDALHGLIDDLRDLGVLELRFSGFEPTRSPFFLALARHAKGAGFYTVLTTNGGYSEGQTAEIIGLGFDEILVSLDGDRAFHDDQRVEGSHEQATRLLRELSRNGVRTKINMTVSRSNLVHMAEVARLGAALGHTVQFIPFRAIGAGACADPRETLAPETMLKMAETVSALRREHPGTRILLAYHDVFDDDPPLYHPMWMSDPCPGRRNVSILNSGQVFYCDFLAELGDTYCAGNVMEAPIGELWRDSPHLRRYRELSRSGRCEPCPHYQRRCSGGCAVEGLAAVERFHDPLCFRHLVEDGATEAGAHPETGPGRYDEIYFRSGCSAGVSNYENFRWLPEKTIPEAKALVALLGLKAGAVVVDFGAAYGYGVRALRLQGIEAYGVDVSVHAVAMARKEPDLADAISLAEGVSGLRLARIDWVLAKDVLEHLQPAAVEAFLREVQATGANLFVMVPLARFDGGAYVIPRNDLDRTHVLRRCGRWWENLLARHFAEVRTYPFVEPFHPYAQDCLEGRGYYACLSSPT